MAFKVESVLFLCVFALILNFSDSRIIKDPFFDDILENLTSLSTGCIFNTNKDLVDPQPLFIVPETNKFWNPEVSGDVKIPTGKSLEFYCSDTLNVPFNGLKSVTATCIGGNVFSVKNNQHKFNEFVCKSWPSFTARRTGKTCHQGSTVVEIGFDLKDRFLQLMQLCHNEHLESTLYVQHKITPSNVFFQRSVPRPNFIEGGFFNGKKVDQLYTKKQQMDTIGKILGGGHEKYFDDSKSFFLARGHLSAKADHIYGSQQRATFYLVNAAPQWQRFNAGNWERVEDAVKQFASKNKMNLDCYTGTWGVTTLADKNGHHKEIFLHIDKNNNGLIPVPKLYYRVVVEPSTKRGIVLIGVNNPHLSLNQILKDYVICPDISDKINWIPWKKTDISSGYSYACDVNQFTKVVNHLPKLDVQSLLY